MTKECEKKQIMCEQPGDPNCPIKSLKLYLDKLNPKCPFLFQKPKIGMMGMYPVWVENILAGVH